MNCCGKLALGPELLPNDLKSPEQTTPIKWGSKKASAARGSANNGGGQTCNY